MPTFEALTDAELLTGSLSDPRLFGVFYDRHSLTVLKYFLRRTSSAEDSADLVGETFAAALDMRQRYTDTGAPATAWIFGIARRQLGRYARTARVSRRYRSRLGIAPLDATQADYEQVEALVDRPALGLALQRGLESLPAAQAAAVRLRVLEQRPYSEVSSSLKCSEGAARVRVSRGLARLHQLVGDAE